MDRTYLSDVNRSVEPAGHGEFRPLALGALQIHPPVVLAPMAGVTNAPFRRVCRSFGRGLFVSEMITARGLSAGNKKTWKLASFAADETPRSVQLYSSDPACLEQAARLVVEKSGADHIDLNFGCPVRKVTGHGGGAAIPLKPKLLARLVGAAVRGAGRVPVTVKFRKGIDDERLTYREAGRVAEAEGAAAVGLHARTAEQLYDGDADWEAIADLKSRLTLPVLGNGDVFEAHDALRMMRRTGCDGVIVGRGCLGRPWLFRDLEAVFAGRQPDDPPHLGEVAEIAVRHGRALVRFFGEYLGVRHMRRHGAWYTKGFPGSAEVRHELNRTTSFAAMEALFRGLPAAAPFPRAAVRARRAKHAGRQKVALPAGFLDADDDLPAAAALCLERRGLPEGG